LSAEDRVVHRAYLLFQSEDDHKIGFGLIKAEALLSLEQELRSFVGAG